MPDTPSPAPMSAEELVDCAARRIFARRCGADADPEWPVWTDENGYRRSDGSGSRKVPSYKWEGFHLDAAEALSETLATLAAKDEEIARLTAKRDYFRDMHAGALGDYLAQIDRACAAEAALAVAQQRLGYMAKHYFVADAAEYAKATLDLMGEAAARTALNIAAKEGARRPVNRIDYDDDGALDEVVTDGGCHLERLGEKNWYLNCIRADGSSFVVWFTGKINHTEEREAPDAKETQG